MNQTPQRLRLDRFLTETTGLSRSQAQRLLRERRVSVDGEIVRTGRHSVSAESRILLDEQALTWPTPAYLMLHKPDGVVCDRTHDFHASVFELLTEHPRVDKLHLAGRLDVDTTGLVLLTDDGQWSHRITSPRHRCPKRYHAILEKPLSQEGRQAIEQGLQLRNEDKPCEPASIEMVEPMEIYITVTEGRYHLVKRLLAAAGAPVEQLHRAAIGSLSLDPNLAPGQWRELSSEEHAAF